MWHDPIVFYNHIFASGEDSLRARINLGVVYEERNQPELALEQYRHVLEVTDNYDEAHYNYAMLLFKMHPAPTPAMLDEGIKHFQRALELNPDFYQASDALAAIYGDIGDPAKEAEYSARSAAIKKKLGIE